MPNSRYKASNELIDTAKQARHNGNPIPLEPPIPTADQRKCEERIRDLTQHCMEEYNIDPQHIRLITSALIPSKHMPVWMIYETTRTPFWNHLNYSIQQMGMPPLCNLSGMRLLRTATSQQWYQEWSVSRHEHPRVFIDTHRFNDRTWRKHVGPYHGYWLITQECVKATIPAAMLKLPRQGAEEELARLLRMVVVDSTDRRPWPEPVQPSRPIAEIINALPRLNEELGDGEVLFNSMCMLVGGHAAMYGRGTKELADVDWLNMMQAIRGSIRQWVRDILHWFYLQDSKGRIWVNPADLAERLGIDARTARSRMEELVVKGVMTRWRKGKAKAANKHQRGTRLFYALTDLGMLGASVIGAGVGVRWW